MRALFDAAMKRTDPRWSDLWLRTASALVLGPLAIFCAWRGGLAWNLLLLVAMAGLGREWGRLTRVPHAYVLGALLGLVWLAQMLAGPVVALLVIPPLWLLAWYRFGAFAGYGIPYAGLGGIALIWLRQLSTGLADTIFLVMIVWGTDIGAYMVGRLVGGAKLAPRISPGKTWSGAAGGLLAAAAIGALFAGSLAASPWLAVAAGGMLSVFAQSGDLLESAIKRKLGVKDSGRTIPGHGGLFDRLDGFLAAAPVAALLAFCVQGGPLWR